MVIQTNFNNYIPASGFKSAEDTLPPLPSGSPNTQAAYVLNEMDVLLATIQSTSDPDLKAKLAGTLNALLSQLQGISGVTTTDGEPIAGWIQDLKNDLSYLPGNAAFVQGRVDTLWSDLAASSSSKAADLSTVGQSAANAQAAKEANYMTVLLNILQGTTDPAYQKELITAIKADAANIDFSQITTNGLRTPDAWHSLLTSDLNGLPGDAASTISDIASFWNDLQS